MSKTSMPTRHVDARYTGDESGIASNQSFREARACRPPTVFTTEMDVSIWLARMEGYLRTTGTTAEELVTVARSFVSDDV